MFYAIVTVTHYACNEALQRYELMSSHCLFVDATCKLYDIYQKIFNNYYAALPQEYI